MRLKKSITTLFFILLIALMLLYSEHSLYFALTGLNLWFLKMIPTLLPFMILSGIMVRMNLTEYFAGLVYPIIYPLFHISKNAAYCIVMGFLCGFPMGAKVIAELYDRKKISKEEAEYLLSFCNNIGPIYFIGFVLPTIGRRNILPYILGMYGLPLAYGLVLRYTKYRSMEVKMMLTKKAKAAQEKKTELILFYADDAINAAADSIMGLGGYMILFNLLNLIPHTIFLLLHKTDEISMSVLAAINGFLEITSGINRMGDKFPMLVLILLPFGGLSCIAQTYSIIKNTDISLARYIRHKVCLAACTVLYYVFLFVFLPEYLY